MDYNSTFLGLIVAGVILIAIGFGLVLSQFSLHPAAALVASQKAERADRDAGLRTVGEEVGGRKRVSQSSLAPFNHAAPGR